jgi:bifunctional DNase/RNase
MTQAPPQLKCGIAECNERATFHLMVIKDRRVAKMLHFCNLHRESTIVSESGTKYSFAEGSGPAQVNSGGGAVFDLDLLCCDELLEEPAGRNWVQLGEARGCRRIALAVGMCEYSALGFELQRSRWKRPLTHRAMVSAVMTLGGDLTYVEIDKFFPSQQTYEAKLHIRQMNNEVLVDVRPSDAFVLAVICDVPIMVSEEVLSCIAKRYG